jgi:hypothetical protein
LSNAFRAKQTSIPENLPSFTNTLLFLVMKIYGHKVSISCPDTPSTSKTFKEAYTISFIAHLIAF